MKRLLIDVDSIVPNLVSGKITGIGRTTLELVDALNKVYNQIPFNIKLYSQNMKGIGGKNLGTKFNATHLYLPHRNVVNRCLGYLPIREILAPYDLIHIPHNFDYVYNPDKTIVTLHDALFMNINEKAFNHLEMRKLVPPLMQKCKGIITCSEASKNDIVNTMSIDPQKITVIYWGIKHEVFHPYIDKIQVKDDVSNSFGIKNPYFLSVSCNAERKNTHRLVEAYLLLSKQNPKNDLVLVWSNPPAFVLKMIEQANMNHRVHFLSNLTDQELALLYNGATSLIFPSSYEGFGLPVLEAMACGVPVVTCRNSSLPEVGRDAVLYMDEPNRENILAFLERFENNRINIAHLSGKGVQQASLFRWEDTANQYLRIYNRYLNA